MKWTSRDLMCVLDGGVLARMNDRPKMRPKRYENLGGICTVFHLLHINLPMGNHITSTADGTCSVKTKYKKELFHTIL